LINKKTYKKIKSLKSKKFRYAQERFIVEGLRLLNTILDEGAILECVVFTKTFESKNSEFIEKINNEILFEVSEKEMKDLSNTISPSGILAVTKFPLYSKLNSNKNIVFLDQISDPGNMGTMLRTASWFGIEQIVLSSNCIDPYNPKVVAAAMGSHFQLKFLGEQKLNRFDDYLWIGASLDGKKLTKSKILNKKWILVMGSEARGIDERIKLKLDETYTIPRLGKGESLNVGVAMGIFLNKIVS
jgi:TrmH family RNA methyltransferase